MRKMLSQGEAGLLIFSAAIALGLVVLGAAIMYYSIRTLITGEWYW